MPFRAVHKWCFGSILQGLRTQIPPKHIQAPLISMKTTQIPPDTPRYPTDTPHTSHRHPPDISREHDMPTDHNRCQQTPPDILKQHLSVYWGVWRGGVCWRLLACLVPWRDLGGVRGMCGGRLGVSEWKSWKSEALGCVWWVSGFSVLAVWSQNTILAKP